MAGDAVQANVVLTADNSQYDQAMDQSTESTNKLATSLDSLGGKMNALTKSAGRKVLGMTMADVGVITAATAAWVAYDKQMALLRAQSAVLGQTQTAQTKILKNYTASVTELRKEFGTTTTEAAQLTQTVSKLAGSTGQLTGLTRIFQQMSMATGESSSGLASSVLGLQKIMSTPINEKSTRQYADQLTYLAAKSDTTATALADFSSQLAPMGRAMGMSQKQVTGFASMFSKAGQEGYIAGSAFTKVAQDITYAIQTGSPDLKQYSNLLGVSVKQFKDMGAEKQMTGFFDAIAKQGPKAAMVLNQFGFDGVRMAKSIVGTVQASGGAANAIRQATMGMHSNATTKGAEAAESLTDTLGKIRQELQMTAESFAQFAGPGLQVFLHGVEKVAGVFEDLMSGPLGKFVALIAGIAVPIGLFVASLGLLAGVLFKVATAFTAVRNSASLGFMEGMRGGSRIVPEVVNGIETGSFMATSGGKLGKRGAQLATDPRSSWFQRGMYNLGQRPGAALRGGYQGLAALPFFTGPPGGPSPASIMGAKGVQYTSQMVLSTLDQARYDNPAARNVMMSHFAPWMKRPGLERFTMAQDVTNTARGIESTKRQEVAQARVAALATPGDQASQKLVKQKEEEYAASKKVTSSALKAEGALLSNATSNIRATEKKIAADAAQLGMMAQLRKEGASFGMALTKTTLNVTKLGAVAAGSAIKSGISSIGPMNLAMIGLMVAPLIAMAGKSILGHFGIGNGDTTSWKLPPQVSTAGSYLAAAGKADIAATYGASPLVSKSLVPQNVSPLMARRITQADIVRATSDQYHVSASSKPMEGMTKQQMVARLAPVWDSIGTEPQARELLKYDLLNLTGSQPDTAWVMKQLDSGSKGAGLDAFLSSGAFTGTHEERAKLLGRARELVGVRAQAAALNFGPQAGQQAYAEGIGSLYQHGVSRTAPTFQQDLIRSGRYNFDGRAPSMASISATRTPDQQAAFDALQDALGLKISGYAVPLHPLASAPDDVKKMAGAVRQAAEDWTAAGKDMASFRTVSGIASDVFRTGDKASMRKFLSQGGVRDVSLTGEAGYQAYMAARLRPPERTDQQMSYENRILMRTGAGGIWGDFFAKNKELQDAISHNAADVAANVKGINVAMGYAQTSGQTPFQTIKQLGALQSGIGTDKSPTYQVLGMVSQQVQQLLSIRQTTMTRADSFGTDVSKFKAVAAIDAKTPGQFADRQQAEQNIASSMADQVNYFKQMLLMQDQYEISRRRAEEDFSLQRQYAQHDYDLGRKRAEDSYNRQRRWAIADYYRQVKEANRQYNLGRQRAEDDFAHQTEVSAKQMAMSVYDIYTRIESTRTSSATWLLSNAADQLDRMKTQEEDLQKLRSMGMSDMAIQQLGLTDPKNQQQLARFITEMTPEMIRQFNQLAGKERVKAAKDLMTDPSSLDWSERARQFNLTESRARQDHEHQMELTRENFWRGLHQQETNFQISMNDQATDYDTSMARMVTAHKTQMTRAAEDLANSAKEIDMSMEEVLTTSVDQLTGHAKKQAEAVLAHFRNLKNDTDPQAIALMQDLASIFGFKYQIPKGLAYHPAESPEQNLERHGVGPEGHYEGGVIPGWNPGRDTHLIKVGGGESVMRPEWTRAVGGEKAVEKMNHAARHGGEGYLGDSSNPAAFAGGGVLNNRQLTRARQFALSQVGDPYVWTGVGPNGYDCSGFQSAITNVLRGQYPYARLGATATFPWPGFVPGPGQYTIGSTPNFGGSGIGHMAGTLNGLNVESQGDLGVVAGDRARGWNDPGFSQHYHLGEAGDFGGSGTVSFAEAAAQGRLAMGKSIFKKLYDRPERAAYAMQGVHPLGIGDISTVLNRFGKRAMRKMIEQYGNPFSDFGDSIGSQPTGNMTNERIVHTAARRMGWGDQWPALRNLVMGESGFRNTAQNPTSSAYGMFQFLDGTWAGVGGHKTSDPWLQTKYGLRYIQSTYGGPRHAWDLWKSRDPHWYGDGSVFTGPQTIGVGEKGPEAVIPLNDRGAEFMARSVGLTASPVRSGGMNLYKTQIDRSTNFTGPITVQANDPAELITKLQARQRVMALSRPSLTGSAA